jgi:hypothetical protein
MSKSAPNDEQAKDSATKRTPVIRRKEFLAGTGAAVVGLTYLQGPALGGDSVSLADGSSGPFSPVSATVVTGVVEKVDPPARVFLRTGKATTRVDFSNDALFWHDEATDLADFAVGEEVVAEGAWTAADVFEGQSLINLYREVNGEVTGRQGDRLETTSGAIRVTKVTRRQSDQALTTISSTDVALGDQISALGRVDPTSGDLVALRLSVF